LQVIAVLLVLDVEHSKGVSYVPCTLPRCPRLFFRSRALFSAPGQQSMERLSPCLILLYTTDRQILRASRQIRPKPMCGSPVPFSSAAFGACPERL
jgi:hypothetical protein